MNCIRSWLFGSPVRLRNAALRILRAAALGYPAYAPQPVRYALELPDDADLADLVGGLVSNGATFSRTDQGLPVAPVRGAHRRGVRRGRRSGRRGKHPRGPLARGRIVIGETRSGYRAQRTPVLPYWVPVESWYDEMLKKLSAAPGAAENAA